MRMRMLVLFCLLLPTVARGGQLVLSADGPVVFMVNALPHPVAEDPVELSLKQGVDSARIQVLNLLGQRQWSGQVSVPLEGRVVLRWADRKLEVLRRETGPAPAPVRATPSLPSSAPRDAGTPDFAAVVADATQSGASPPADAGPEPEASRSEPAGAEAGMVELRIVNRGRSWLDFTLGGSRYEFRTGRHAIHLELAPGSHALTVRDFQTDEVWWSGQVQLSAGEPVELQIGQAAPPGVLGRPEAWQPDP